MKTYARFFWMVLAGCLPLQAQAQTQTVSALFQEEKPLSLEFTISIREVKKNLVDSVYFPAQLKYQNPDNL